MNSRYFNEFDHPPCVLWSTQALSSSYNKAAYWFNVFHPMSCLYSTTHLAYRKNDYFKLI